MGNMVAQLLASWTPVRAVRVQVLARVIGLCSWKDMTLLLQCPSVLSKNTTK